MGFVVRDETFNTNGVAFMHRAFQDFRHAASSANVPTAMKTTREQALAEATQLFLNFRGLARGEWMKPYDAVDEFMFRLVEEGWTRKDLFHLVNDIDTSPEAMPEDCSDAVDGSLRGLIGWCSPACITRLPGEPTDMHELAAYVLGREWMK